MFAVIALRFIFFCLGLGFFLAKNPLVASLVANACARDGKCIRTFLDHCKISAQCVKYHYKHYLYSPSWIGGYKISEPIFLRVGEKGGFHWASKPTLWPKLAPIQCNEPREHADKPNTINKYLCFNDQFKRRSGMNIMGTVKLFHQISMKYFQSSTRVALTCMGAVTTNPLVSSTAPFRQVGNGLDFEKKKYKN